MSDTNSGVIPPGPTAAPPAPPSTSPIPQDAIVVTGPQVAGMAQVNLRTVERWAASDRIPGRVRLPGRGVRYLRDVVEEWLRDGCPPPERANKRQGPRG
jgi:hypothetical protein